MVPTNVNRQKYKHTITTKILRWIHINICKTLVKSENPFRRFLSFILDVFYKVSSLEAKMSYFTMEESTEFTNSNMFP